MQFHDPRGVPSAPLEPYEHRIDVSADVSVALLANNFPDSIKFLDHVEAVLVEQVPGISIGRYAKPNASVAVSDEMLTEIVAQHQTVVAAYGH